MASDAFMLECCVQSWSRQLFLAPVFMAALRSRCRHYIFAMWFLLSSSSFSSPNLSGRRLDVYHTWCGPSADLECRSETCCMHLTGNAGPKKSPFGHHRTTFGFATETCIDSWKKTCWAAIFPPHVGPLAADIVSLVWGTPANFKGFRFLAALLRGTSTSTAKLCGVEQRAPPIFGRAAITLGIGPHF